MNRSGPIAVMLVLAAGRAFASEPPAEAPTATAPTDVADQIAAYLRDSPAASLPADAPRTTSEQPLDRRPHGVFEVGVGSHGYRSVYLQTEVPLGEKGRLSVAIGESRGRAPRIVHGAPGTYGPYDFGVRSPGPAH